MKVYLKLNDTNDNMIKIMQKLTANKFIILAIVSSDFLLGQEFGGGEFNEGSVLHQLHNGEIIEMDLTLPK